MSDEVFTYTIAEGIRPSAEKIDWADGESADDFARRNGYNTQSSRLGPEFGWHLEWLERAPDVPNTSLAYRFQYHVWWTNGLTDGQTILVIDFANLLALQAYVSPIIQADQTLFFQEQFRPLFERLFRVYHGHDPSQVCNACDPDEVRSREVERKRL